MLASIHVADLSLPAAIRAHRSYPKREATPGLRYATPVLAAPLKGSIFKVPQPRRVGLIALWNDAAALDEFLSTDPMAAALAGGWHVRLATVQAHEYQGARGADQPGVWPGLDGDIDIPAPHRAPAIVLTLARTRPSQIVRFARASQQAARPLANADGLIWTSALVRPPIVATMSVWASPDAVAAYAYGDENSGHRRAMAADRQRPFHQSGVFFRFHPIASAGSLSGRNPIAADWMAGAASGDTSAISVPGSQEG